MNSDDELMGGEIKVISWNNYRPLSEDFLRQHHDLVLYDVFHQVVAFLLYPLRCGCGSTPCQCDLLRENINLSLNLELYNSLGETHVKEIHEDSKFLIGARVLLNIPQESFFQEIYTKAYPSLLIEKNWRKEEINFKRVDHFAWTLLRLNKTHQHSILRRTKTSMSESIKVIFGETPVKTKKREKSKNTLGGEHAYKREFKRYKSVAHFIAALQFMKKPKNKKHRELLLFSWDQADQIESFLKLADWFRQKFLLLQTPNTKKREVFLPEEIIPLPSWVLAYDIDIPIKPFPKALEKMNAPYLHFLNQESA